MRTSGDLRGIAGLAACQNGVVTGDQLSALGLTARVVHRLVVPECASARQNVTSLADRV